ncbi:MAG: SDR family oxidoreductase [Candidatus Aminicenantes bacterium]
MERYLVTGGAGFIGSNIVEELLSKKEEVRVLDNFLTGKKENIAPFLDKIEFMEGDIRDYKTCCQAVEGVNRVLHQAALPSVPRSIADPVLANDINIKGTLNLLLASRDKRVKRFVFASSSSVYGDDPALPKKETMPPRPLSPYALTKMVGEMYCRIFRQIYGLSTVSLRYFNIFGPRQDPFSQYAAVIPNFINKILHGERPVIFGDGRQSRDFTYVANVVEANILAAKSQKVTADVINVACGRRTTVNSLAARINRILKKDLKPSHAPPRPGDVKHSFADISRAKKELKYSPQVSFDQGLEKTIRWYQEREER